MMATDTRPGLRCTECGARLDRNEYYSHICECEREAAEKRTAKQLAHTRRIIAHNIRMMEQAQTEFDYR